ncbi:hypothetical protein D3C86_2144250 [compost metagenome]
MAPLSMHGNFLPRLKALLAPMLLVLDGKVPAMLVERMLAAILISHRLMPSGPPLPATKLFELK